MALIETVNLEKIYHDGETSTPALCGINLQIEKGEFLAIMGPSGSGKSTLLQILGFLDKNSGGKYFFDGKTIDDYSDDEIAHVRNEKMGFIFQAFNLLPRTSVLDNVKLPLQYSKVPSKLWDEFAMEAIKKVGLEHRAQHEPSQLSGGEKQRVAIARALINNPEVIFADEPTGNLDSKSGESVMDILQNLNEQRGYTIILITHETYTAEHSQRIIFIRDGKMESDKKVKKQHKVGDGILK